MVVEYPKEKWTDLLPLFENHSYLQLIIEASLKEQKGKVFVNNIDNPSTAMILHEVLIFLAGDSTDPSLDEFLKLIPQKRLIFIPKGIWVDVLRKYWKDKLHEYPRTKFSSEKLDIKHLQEIQKGLPQGLILEKLSNEYLDKISDQAKNIVGILFSDLQSFFERNFGFCIRDGEKIISLALAASPIYNKDFEIHIETDPEHQRRGLAMIACAKLIEYSLMASYIPHWDADNEPSAKLALKLGFTDPERYFAYFWVEK